jgi:mono/diheme cytochrome c family protein
MVVIVAGERVSGEAPEELGLYGPKSATNKTCDTFLNSRLPAYDFTDGNKRRATIGSTSVCRETTPMNIRSQLRWNAPSVTPRRQPRRSRQFCPLSYAPLKACFLLLVSSISWNPAVSRAAEPGLSASAAERGYRWLTTKTYLPADFDQEVFDNLWKVWPAELREQARQETSAERRRMTFSRYGLAERPEGDAAPTALGYVPDGKSGWAMNCLACHTGKVAGNVILGAPNSLFALETLTEEVRQTKLRMLKPFTHMDLGSLKMPLGTSRGTTNAVMFGVALGALRDPDLNVRRDLAVPPMLHHDADAPPFWNVRRKKYIYADGFVAKSHRPLLQFVMVPENTGKTLRSWEQDYADILAWIESLEAPKYPGTIDRSLAAQGKVAFERVCAQCHGTYGEDASYPNRIVAIEEVGTDPVRLQSLSVEYRKSMQDGWFGDYGAKKYVTDPGGYIAPPLNGIWASAPYLHNGSVPTLWHLLHPNERPVVWRRTEEGYDHSRVGLEITPLDSLPESAKAAAEKREYFDTRRRGKSAAGHPFPNELSAGEKQSVLEYLKSL